MSFGTHSQQPEWGETWIQTDLLFLCLNLEEETMDGSERHDGLLKLLDPTSNDQQLMTQ